MSDSAISDSILRKCRVDKVIPSRSDLQSVAGSKDPRLVQELVKALETLAGDPAMTRYDCCRSLMAISELFNLAGSTQTDRSQDLETDSESLFRDALSHFEKGQVDQGLESCSQICQGLSWTGSNLSRLSHEYEKVVFAIIRGSICQLGREAIQPLNCFSNSKTRKVSQMVPMGQWVVGTSPARLDLAGSWTDTPPICTDFGGRVCGIAINPDKERPIGCKVRRISEPLVKLVMIGDTQEHCESINLSLLGDFEDHNNPTAKAALIKACLVFVSIVKLDNDEQTLSQQLTESFEGGFELHTWSKLPHGSGLGTSSILAGCILAVLWKAIGSAFSLEDLTKGVLVVEQILTTGGGWQDQVNGLYPGIKFASSTQSNGLSLSVLAPKVDDIKEQLDLLEAHLVLVFTGDVRLAKNLLQNVIREWYLGSSEIPKAIKANYDTADQFWTAFQLGDIAKMGSVHRQFWNCKKILAKGAETWSCKAITKACQDLVYGESLAGAGGGGFMVLITKRPNIKSEIEALLRQEGLQQPCYSIQIDRCGLRLEVNGQHIPF